MGEPVPASSISIWARAWRRGAVRIGVAATAAILLLGIYAPFLANDVALVWSDAGGLRFPLFADLFNRWSYPKYYDVYFNVAALLLPFLVVGGILLRRRWSLTGRILAGLGIIILAGTASMLPVIPGALELRPLWTWRLQTADLATAPAEGRSAVFPPIAFRSSSPVSGQVLVAPGSVDPASGRHFWLGTDSVGRDVASQLLAGARISLTIGLVATGLSLLIGLILGAVSGYFGGWIDLLIQRIVEVMMCFPTFILILVVVAILGRDIFIIMTVIGLTSWAGTARLVRGEFLAQSVRDYVAAGQSLGLGSWRIMFRHILPNALTPLLISATFGIAGAVLSESGLAFLGLGDPNVASWGALLEQGRQNIDYSWLIWLPGMAVFILVSALNLIGNGLREAADAASE